MSNLSIKEAISSQREQLLNHPAYSRISSLEDLQLFMEHHVYAVWDFMSLLKSLQRNLTCVELPWKPVGDANIRHFINEIVLGEECDINWNGNMQSHFEMYVSAMDLAGADTQAISDFVNELHSVDAVFITIEKMENEAVKNFLHFTFSLIKENKAHKIAAAFTFGREDLIPGMFTGIVDHLKMQKGNEGLAAFDYYLKRHIEVDGDEHGPLALKLMDALCEDDPNKWKEAEETAVEALNLRIALWDNIGAKLYSRTPVAG